MERILVIINSRKLNTRSIEFACSIARLTNSPLTGLIVENIFFEHVPSTEAAQISSHNMAVQSISGKDRIITADTDQSIELFKEICEQREVAYDLYLDKGEPIQKIIFESRFADLMIIDPEISFYDREEDLPSHF